MLYSLSNSVILDTVHALAAMEMLGAGEETETILAPLLDPERRAPLALMIKNAFAELVVELLPYVDSAALDSETAVSDPGHHEADRTADSLMQIALRTPQTLPSGAHGLVRRQLELAVVYRTMELAVLSAGSTCGNTAATTLISNFNASVETAKTTLRTLLTSAVQPFIRPAAP